MLENIISESTELIFIVHRASSALLVIHSLGHFNRESGERKHLIVKCDCEFGELGSACSKLSFKAVFAWIHFYRGFGELEPAWNPSKSNRSSFWPHSDELGPSRETSVEVALEHFNRASGERKPLFSKLLNAFWWVFGRAPLCTSILVYLGHRFKRGILRSA